MPKALLDTSAYLDLQRSAKQRREVWSINTFRHLAKHLAEHGKPWLSYLSIIELSAGFKQVERTEKIKTFLDVVLPEFEIIGLDVPSACLAGEIYERLESAGMRIGIADTGIAAIALQNESAVVTSNIKHFQRVADLGYPLEVKNWRES